MRFQTFIQTNFSFGNAFYTYLIVRAMAASAQKSTVTAPAIDIQKPKFFTLKLKKPHIVSEMLTARTNRKAKSSFRLMRLMAAFWFKMICL